MLGSEEIPSTQDHNNFVTNVAMTKMTSENNSYYAPSHSCMTRLKVSAMSENTNFKKIM